MFEKLRKIIQKLVNKRIFDEVSELVLYICGNEALPLPLDGETEGELLLLCQQGDSGARSMLIEHNLRLVVYIAKRYDNTGFELEDLISIGAIGLIKAVQTYSLDKNIKLATYASRCIENEILMQLRKTSKLKNEVSIEEPLNSDGDGNELLLADILSTEGDTVSKDIEQSDEKRLLYLAIEHLGEKEKQIMWWRFGLAGYEEKTQKEVADMMGISQSYISRIEKKILDRLKKELLKTAN